MTAALQTNGLGKTYGRRWALSDCTLHIPAGRVVGQDRDHAVRHDLPDGAGHG